MSYSDFRLPDVIEKFALVTREAPGIFADRQPVQPSPLLIEYLRLHAPLVAAIGNGKARSEYIVAPVLAEVQRLHSTKIGFFSGVELSVDPASGLTGTCDYLFSLTPEQLFVKAPIVTVVEAKKEDLAPGMGQCVAEMIGTRLFNERANNAIETVYGAVTSGTSWRFMSLSGGTLAVDLNEYLVSEVDRILGILMFMTSPQS